MRPRHLALNSEMLTLFMTVILTIVNLKVNS
jgi:hypothetical protein